MKYFFVLGNNTSLSVAEILSVLYTKHYYLLAKDLLVIDSDQEINPQNLIRRLGGVIKIGRVVLELDNNEAILEKEIAKLIRAKQSNISGGKFNFGFSDYGQHNFNKRKLGLKLKFFFKEKGINTRLVVSREKNLSSVVVTQNKLLGKGIEIILASHEGKVIVGETLAVQPFKDLSLRDYGRPARDHFSGMLPPKLAQIMINLAQVVDKNSVIIDPFCGSGTILSEATLLGYNNLFGSDISSQAIENTYKNVNWLKGLYKLEGFKLKLHTKKVENLSKFIKANLATAIITEPFLGPQRGQIDFTLVAHNLEILYSQALKEFWKVLKPTGRVVMIWPMFYGYRPISPNYSGFKIVSLLPKDLIINKFIKSTNRNTIIYGRPGQKVYREVVVLDKIEDKKC